MYLCNVIPDVSLSNQTFGYCNKIGFQRKVEPDFFWYFAFHVDKFAKFAALKWLLFMRFYDDRIEFFLNKK